MSYSDEAVPATPAQNKQPVVGIEFYNSQPIKRWLHLEPWGLSVVLEAGMEYRLESDDLDYRLEFGPEDITFYQQYSFLTKLYKRPYSTDFKNRDTWELIEDY